MARKRRGSRIYWRERGGEPRAWGDFRDFADVGGRREPLVPRGAEQATTDHDFAEKLASARVTALEKARRNRDLLGIAHQRELEAYASHHLKEKARAGRVTREHLEEIEHRLDVAIRYFGADRLVDSISVRDIDRFAGWLARQKNHRGGALSPTGCGTLYIVS